MFHKRCFFLTFLLFLLIKVNQSHAIDSSHAFTTVPARYTQKELTLSTRGLGDTCYSRGVFPDGSVCNPARLTEVKDSNLMGRFFIGNGYAALNSADSLLNKPLTKEFLQSLFKENSSTSVEAHAGIVFTTKNFQASFSPYRVQYASEIRNPNLQVMSIHAALERSFNFSYGESLSEEWSIGGKLRLLNRQFIHSTFSLFTAISEEPSQYIPVQKQSAIFLEPSLVYKPKNAVWNLNFSAAVENLGSVNKGFAEYPNDPDLQLGVSVEPPISIGKVKLGLESRDLFYTSSFLEGIRFGASYQYGVMEVMTGINHAMFTSGILFNFSILQAGVVYEFIHDDYVNSGLESRIATEFSVKL